MPLKILEFFEYGHLPASLRQISARFHSIAHEMVLILPDNEEREVMLRKLLEAKDAAVRSKITRS